MHFSWSNADFRTGAVHPWSDFSGCERTRRTRPNVIPEMRDGHSVRYRKATHRYLMALIITQLFLDQKESKAID